MVVSLDKGNPIYTPIYYNFHEDPKKVHVIYKSQHKEGRSRMTTWEPKH